MRVFLEVAIVSDPARSSSPRVVSLDRILTSGLDLASRPTPLARHDQCLGFDPGEIHERARRRRQLLADRVGEVPVVLQRESLDVKADQARGFWLQPEREARHDRYAQAGKDGFLDRLVRTQLQSDLRG